MAQFRRDPLCSAPREGLAARTAVEIDRNTVERTIWPIKLGDKNISLTARVAALKARPLSPADPKEEQQRISKHPVKAAG